MGIRDKQKEETKRRIYDVAFSLFDQYGYDQVKVSDIANKAHVSVGSVYYHYKNKEAIIDFGYFEFDQKLKEEYEKQNFSSSREAILFLVNYQIQMTEEKLGLKRATICFKNQMNSENTYLYSKERYLYQKLVENLENQSLQFLTGEKTAQMILRISRGTIYDWCCHEGSYDLKQTVLQEVLMILDYVGLSS